MSANLIFQTLNKVEQKEGKENKYSSAFFSKGESHNYTLKSREKMLRYCRKSWPSVKTHFTKVFGWKFCSQFHTNRFFCNVCKKNLFLYSKCLLVMFFKLS